MKGLQPEGRFSYNHSDDPPVAGSSDISLDTMNEKLPLGVSEAEEGTVPSSKETSIIIDKNSEAQPGNENSSHHDSDNQSENSRLPGTSNDTATKNRNRPIKQKKKTDVVKFRAKPRDSISGPPSAKDSKYGWMVVFMVYLVNTVTAGYVKSFGITYTLILDYFPDTSGAASGWIMGLLVGCRGLLAPVMGALTVKAGPRKCVVTGTLMCVVGLLLAVPAFSVPYLAFTLGGIVGTGLCLSETPGFILVTDYFDKKRAMANGFRAAGNPTGGIIFAPLVVFLNQYYGLRGTFIMIAALMLQMVVFAMFMRPFEIHEKLVHSKYWKERLEENDISALRVKRLKDQQARQNVKKKKPLDLTFLKNPAYLVYLVMVTFTSCALPSALLYLPAYGRSIGLTDFQNSAVASYTSCCDVVMRLVCGWIFTKEWTNRRYGYAFGLVVGGIACLIIPLCTELWHLLIFSTMYSLCMAFYWTLINVLLADQFGGDAMATTWGFFRMLQGMCNFLYPSLLGYVLDLSGGLGVPYMLMGSLLLIGAAIYLMQPLIAKLPGSKINFS